MPTITVGSGHVAPDYATAQLAWDTLSGSDQGSDVICDCLGDCGATFTANTTPVNNWLFHTQSVTYDGTSSTLAQLSTINRVNLAAGSSKITIEDMIVTTGNNFVNALILAGSGNALRRNRIIGGNNISAVSIPVAESTNAYEFNVISLGSSPAASIDVISVGFADGCISNNNLVFSGTDKGVEGAGSVGIHIITNMFSFNNTSDDIEQSVFTVNSSATEDTTGTSGLTGFTSSELVDFANDDFRTKSTSTLATSGTGAVSYIGAFLEASSGISVTEQLKNINYTSNNPVITLTGTISVTEQLKNISYNTLNPSITLTSSLQITEQTKNINYSSLNPSITLTGVISVTEQTKSIQYTSNNPTIDLTGIVSIVEQASNYNVSSNNPTITLTPQPITIIEQTRNVQYQALNPSILLTPEPIGIVSTVCFPGCIKELSFNGLSIELEFNGDVKTVEFNGNLKDLEFNGTIKQNCTNGKIKTDC